MAVLFIHCHAICCDHAEVSENYACNDRKLLDLSLKQEVNTELNSFFISLLRLFNEDTQSYVKFLKYRMEACLRCRRNKQIILFVEYFLNENGALRIKGFGELKGEIRCCFFQNHLEMFTSVKIF